MYAGSEIKVAILRFDLPSRSIFPRWTSSGSAAAALSRSANGNRLRRRQKGVRCSVGKDETGARKRRKHRDRREGESPRGNKNNRNGSSAGDAKSGARREEKGSDQRKAPRTGRRWLDVTNSAESEKESERGNWKNVWKMIACKSWKARPRARARHGARCVES